MKILPVGQRLLISPIVTENHKSDGGIEIVQNELSEGIVVEVSGELSHLYNVNDLVLYPSNAGQSQYYNGKTCVWLGVSEIWGIVTKD